MGTPETSNVLLRGRDITRRWGGLVAVNRVSLELERGQVHAVIGTNGAGKSTLVNILSGEIPASEGTVELLGQEVTAWSQPRRARAGLGRSYQRTTIYPSFTVAENCRLAAQARTPLAWRWWEDAAQEQLVTDTPLGFGAGTTFETKAGLFSLTYALGRQFGEPVQLRGGKIHFGFTSLF